LLRLIDSVIPQTDSRSYFYYPAPVGERNIAISLSVCVSVCLSVHEHISGTAGPIFTKFCVQIPCGRGSVPLWWRCNTLCTSGFMDDVTLAVVGRVWCRWMPCC